MFEEHGSLSNLTEAKTKHPVDFDRIEFGV